jgi:hypothetical protein
MFWSIFWRKPQNKTEADIFNGTVWHRYLIEFLKRIK